MNNIKILREQIHITQRELAEILKVGQSTVAMWEVGKAMPTADKLPELARILGCTIDALFRTTEERKEASQG